jgi:spore germination protein KC
MDYFERTPEIRRNMWLLVSRKGEFENIFTSDANLEAGNDSGKVIRGILRNKSRTSFISTNTLGDFLNLFWETGSEPYTSGIGTAGPSGAKQAAGAGSDKASQKELVIENTAVFTKDRLAGWMDNRESMGLLWITGGIKGGNLSITYEGKEIVMQIIRMHSDIKPVKIKGKIQMNIRIMLVTSIVESQAKLILKNIEVTRKLEDLQAEKIKGQISAALNKSKQLNADAFSFGNYIFGKYPKDWRTMESQKGGYLRDLATNIEVDSIVNHVGLIKNNAP